MLLLDGKITEGETLQVDASGDSLTFDTNPQESGIAA